MFQFILAQATLWCLNPFFRKQALKSFTSTEFQLQVGVGNLILNGAGLYYGKKNGFVFNKWMVLCIINTFAASYCLNYMSKHLNISEFIPVVQPLVIVLTTLIDYTVFNVRFSLKQLTGICFILIGIVLLKFEFKNQVEAVIRKEALV